MSIDSILPILIAFILGAAVGSFLNVVIYRLPEGGGGLFVDLSAVSLSALPNPA